jgi:insertion element IS1 protein InsB
MSRQCTHYGRWPQQILRHLKAQAAVGKLTHTTGNDVIVCAEGRTWGYVGAKSRQRRLFYAYRSEDGCNLLSISTAHYSRSFAD